MSNKAITSTSSKKSARMGAHHEKLRRWRPYADNMAIIDRYVRTPVKYRFHCNENGWQHQTISSLYLCASREPNYV
jgi:hypothetical protein